MDVVHACCAGLDVHKATVVACVRDARERRTEVETQTFGTVTRELLRLLQWLTQRGVTHVAMEATGVLWKPLYNVLEGNVELLLVNARHIKQVPGRKTDVRDAEWIAQLLQHGLLSPSFVPPRSQRQLRDLTRHRTQLRAEQTRVANRIHKTLEDANIKLGAVASDILGVSGRHMLEGLIEGETDAAALADRSKGRMRRKRAALEQSLEGCVDDHHRFMLRLLLDHLHQLETMVAQLDERIGEQLRPFEAQLGLLRTIPGWKEQVAAAVFAEIGPNMNVFPTAGHLASWAGVCPGNNESAGKRKSGRTTRGNRWLRRALTQGAWAAARTKGGYLETYYRRLARRRGRKRAVVALSHTMLGIAYHILSTNQPYQDLGADYLDRQDADRTRRGLVRRLEGLGYVVNLEAAA